MAAKKVKQDDQRAYTARCMVCGRVVLTTGNAAKSGLYCDLNGDPLHACPTCGTRVGAFRLASMTEKCMLEEDPDGRLVKHTCGCVLVTRLWGAYFWPQDKPRGRPIMTCPKCEGSICWNSVKPYHPRKPRVQGQQEPVTAGKRGKLADKLDGDVWAEFVSTLDFDGGTHA